MTSTKDFAGHPERNHRRRLLKSHAGEIAPSQIGTREISIIHNRLS